MLSRPVLASRLQRLKTNGPITSRWLSSTASSNPSPPSPWPSPSSSLSDNAVVFSGIQPTGVPHLGNYLGALRPWRRLQDAAAGSSSSGTRAKLLFCVVDLHAITLPQDASLLRRRRREMLAAFLAIGLDPSRCVLFCQSAVPAHAELMWILSCTASMGYLSRMTQWKSKLSLSQDTSSLDEKAKAVLKLGLFSYPVLQAADVLVHRATHVPVGEDQRQHLEFARECATNFNHAYGGNHLVPPETILSPARRVMSLQNPAKKMSKSDPDPRSCILLTDTPDEMHAKIMSARTDSSNSVSYDPETRPAVANLVELLAVLGDDGSGKGEGGSEKTPQAVAEALRGENLKALKERVSAAVITSMAGIRERFLRVLEEDDGRYLDHVEEEGAKKARQSAEETMQIVRSAVGF